MLSLTDLIERVDRARVRFEFNADARIDFYEQITELYGNGIQMETALARIFQVESNGKAKTRNAIAIVARECIAGLHAGQRFSDVIARWVPADEASVIVTGEDAHDLLAAFERVTVSVQRRQELLLGVWTPLALPALLLLVIFGILVFSGFFFAPQLLALAPLDKWAGATHQLLVVSLVVHDWWWLIVALTCTAGVAFALSLGRWRGKERDWVAIAHIVEQHPDYVLPKTRRDRLDRFAPYSIYRIYVASLFLDSVVQMRSQGASLPDSLASVRRFASPWLREKIDDTLWGIDRGLRLGAALEKAGHDFPDKGTIDFIQVLEESDSTGEALGKFTGRWIQRNIKRMKAAAALLRLLALIGAAVTLVMFYAGVYGISQMSGGF